MNKKILWAILLVLTIVAWWYRSLIYYGYVQAKGQLNIVWNAKPVEEYLSDSTTPDSVRYKLELVNKIRNFSVDRLGILPSNNYTKMFDQQGQPLMWVVTACEPYAMEAYEWSFPIVGSFPYKGFFDPEMAKEESELVKALGYDVGIRNAGGWSTLGWLEDPILSDMLNRNEGQLAELIIHELTHFTLFVKDSVEFNENLASFVGKQGAIDFLTEEFGENSEYLNTYQQSEDDYEKFVRHFIRGAKSLDSLYQSFDEDVDEQQRYDLKRNAISHIVSSLDTVSFYRPERFVGRIDSEKINNTYFMSYLRYRSKQDIFSQQFVEQFDGNVQDFINHYKDKYPAN